MGVALAVAAADTVFSRGWSLGGLTHEPPPVSSSYQHPQAALAAWTLEL